MLFNKDLLFLHMPGGAGVSITEYLPKVLSPPGVIDPNPTGLPAGWGGIQSEWRWARMEAVAGHQTLPEIQEYLEAHGRALDGFNVIISVIRNPYEHALASYSYSQMQLVERSLEVRRSELNGLSSSREHERALECCEESQCAIDCDFESFVRTRWFTDIMPRLPHYFFVDGVMPPNLRILRFERVAAELSQVLDSLGLKNIPPLPHRNASSHADCWGYYTPEAVNVVNEQYGWVFEHGFYDEVSPEQLESMNRGSLHQSMDSVPLSGPVTQDGDASGLYVDRWVGEELIVPVTSKASVERVVVTGALPSFAAGLSLSMEGPSGCTTARVDFHGAFLVTAPFQLEVGSSAVLRVRPLSIWTRAEHGGHDDRPMSFRLNDIAFLPGR